MIHLSRDFLNNLLFLCFCLLAFDSMAAGAEVTGETAVVKATATENSSSLPDNYADSGKISDAGSELSTNAKSESMLDGDKGSDSDPNSMLNSKSEYQMQDLVDMLKTLKLNPLAKEFFPSSYHRDQMGVNNFVGAHRSLGSDSARNYRKV